MSLGTFMLYTSRAVVMLFYSGMATTKCLFFLDLRHNNVEQYRRKVLSESATFRVYINRLAGDFANDVLEVYKNPIEKLCSPVSVKFENETSVGSGPAQEIFSILINMIVDCFPLDGNNRAPTLVFEGEFDHKITVANSSKRMVQHMLGYSNILPTLVSSNSWRQAKWTNSRFKKIQDCFSSVICTTAEKNKHTGRAVYPNMGEKPPS